MTGSCWEWIEVVITVAITTGKRGQMIKYLSDLSTVNCQLGKCILCQKFNTATFMSKSGKKRLEAKLVYWEFIGSAVGRDVSEKMKVELGKQKWILQFSSTKSTAGSLQYSEGGMTL